jgi:phosphoglucosamine mutase
MAVSTERIRRLFGTDGMRGVAGEFPLDARTVFVFGQALGRWARGHSAGPEPLVLIGTDTRESGPWLAETLAGGLASEGAQPKFAGLITTPGVAYLTKRGPFAAGVMISASHNPYQDNGLKAFDHSGYKLPDETELDLEEEIFARLADDPKPADYVLTADTGLDEEYLRFLLSTFPHRLDGKTIVVDCANGAAVDLAGPMFEALGARVIRLACSPDGRNINDGCGALHVETLRERVLAERADAGFAFDGDADRCIAVSASGRILDGDAMLLICGRYLRRLGKLGDSVVATVMSNLGFEKALERDGILLLRTAVGDRYVMEKMRATGVPIGGEQSGHVIFTDYSTTGDGLLTALRVLEAADGKDLDSLIADLEIYPQKLVNLKVREKRPLHELPAVEAEIAAAEQDFNGSGRVLVRYSGTESKIRVMVEGADAARVEHWTARIADRIQAELT